jgi:hypothetical protein
MPPVNNRAIKAISAAFGGAEAQMIGMALIEDAIEVTVTDDRGEHWSLIAVWSGRGWPADVAAFLNHRPADLPTRFVLTAPSFSSGAIELLEEARLNWADELGNAHIRTPGLFVFRQGVEPVRERPAFTWSPSAIAVAEALLTGGDEAGIRTGELANLVDWSPAQVSQVLQAFDANGWTTKYGPQRGPSARRELHDFDGLLDAWSEALRSTEQETRLAHRTMREPLSLLTDELGPALDEKVRWAVGGWAAAQELAPIVDIIPSLQIYVHEDDFDRPLTEAMRAVGVDDVSEGGRVSFHPASPGVLALSAPARFGRLVSAPRVYVDLLRIGGRGDDAARHLREEILVGRSTAADDVPPPAALFEWDERHRYRLRELTRERFGEATDPYNHGSLSVSYRLPDASTGREPARFAHVLREVTDHAGDGWPVWWAPQVGGDRLRTTTAGELECWFVDQAETQPSHADYWAADPQGQLCLIRPYQEDYEGGWASQAEIDAVLQIWRVAECVAHAERLARRLGGVRIQLMARWSGLSERRLVSRERSLNLSPALTSIDEESTSFIETTPDAYAEEPVAVLARLLQPLYRAFGLMEPQTALVAGEVSNMERFR